MVSARLPSDALGHGKKRNIQDQTDENASNSGFPNRHPKTRCQTSHPKPKVSKTGECIFQIPRHARRSQRAPDEDVAQLANIFARTVIESMKTNPLKDGVLTENSTGIGTVTRKMVRERAVELAVINGRSAQDVSKSDCEQAKRELTGASDIDPKEKILESAPESERWNPVPGSTRRKAPIAASEDEDDEGRSDNEKLVEEGVEGAEHDQMRQASQKRDS
jgi:hypothetical protein